MESWTDELMAKGPIDTLFEGDTVDYDDLVDNHEHELLKAEALREAEFTWINDHFGEV